MIFYAVFETGNASISHTHNREEYKNDQKYFEECLYIMYF